MNKKTYQLTLIFISQTIGLNAAATTVKTLQPELNFVKANMAIAQKPGASLEGADEALNTAKDLLDKMLKSARDEDLRKTIQEYLDLAVLMGFVNEGDKNQLWIDATVGGVESDFKSHVERYEAAFLNNLEMFNALSRGKIYLLFAQERMSQDHWTPSESVYTQIYGTASEVEPIEKYYNTEKAYEYLEKAEKESKGDAKILFLSSFYKSMLLASSEFRGGKMKQAARFSLQEFLKKTRPKGITAGEYADLRDRASEELKKLDR